MTVFVSKFNDNNYAIKSISSELKRNTLVYSLIIFSTFSTYLCLKVFAPNIDIDITLTTYLESVLSLIVRTFILWTAYQYINMLINRVEKPIFEWMKRVKGILIPIHKPISFIILALFISMFISTYSYIKILIPELNPYYLDKFLYDLDLWLHAGYSPWELTHTVFFLPEMTLMIDVLYSLWFVIIWVYLIGFIFSSNNERLRNQFLLTFLSCWLVLGSVLAVLLASVGPCYIHLIDSSQNQYSELISLLNHQGNILQDQYSYTLSATYIQNVLWQIYQANIGGEGMGISAMPSLHVSMAVLIALSSFPINKKLGYLMCFYALFIQIGSVHLGWHYAVDGYVSIIITIMLWHLWGWLLKRFNIKSESFKK